MQHLMTLRVYKHPLIEGCYSAAFRNEVTDDTRVMNFTERTRAMEYCKAQLALTMQLSPHAQVHMRQVVRKGVWCYNVFGIDSREIELSRNSLWAYQGRKN